MGFSKHHVQVINKFIQTKIMFAKADKSILDNLRFFFAIEDREQSIKK